MNHYHSCIHNPSGKEEEQEVVRTSQEFLLWEQGLRSKTKVGTRVCHGQGRACISGVTAGREEGRAEQRKRTAAAGSTLQTPGDQLYSANFVMVTWCAQCKSQMWKEIAGLEEMSHGRGKKRHPPTEGSTTAGQHDMEPRAPSEPAQNPLQWANTSEACHTSALCSPTDCPLWFSFWMTWVRLRQGKSIPGKVTTAHQTITNPWHFRDVWLWASCLFFLSFSFLMCVGMFVCMNRVICALWCTCGGQRATSGVVFTFHLVWGGNVVVPYYVRQAYPPESVHRFFHLSLPSHHRFLKLWMCLAFLGFWGPELGS